MKCSNQQPYILNFTLKCHSSYLLKINKFGRHMLQYSYNLVLTFNILFYDHFTLIHMLFQLLGINLSTTIHSSYATWKNIYTWSKNYFLLNCSELNRPVFFMLKVNWASHNRLIASANQNKIFPEKILYITIWYLQVALKSYILDFYL